MSEAVAMSPPRFMPGPEDVGAVAPPRWLDPVLGLLGVSGENIRAGIESLGQRLGEARSEADVLTILDDVDEAVFVTLAEGVRIQSTWPARRLMKFLPAPNPRHLGPVASAFVELGQVYVRAMRSPDARTKRERASTLGKADLLAVDKIMLQTIYDPATPLEYARALVGARRMAPAYLAVLHADQYSLKQPIINAIAKAFSVAAKDALRIVALDGHPVDELLLPLNERLDLDKMIEERDANTQALEKLFAAPSPESRESHSEV